MLPHNIYLVGLMGAGKTTTGRCLANHLQYQFIDTDQVLEKRTGVSIRHIFEVEGESGFRKRETKLLADICEKAADDDRGTVISTGGGIILSESNCQAMRESGSLVYLRATVELLWRRLQGGRRRRPLLNVADPKNAITQLLAIRDPLYTASAHFIVDVGSESASATALKIHALLAA